MSGWVKISNENAVHLSDREGHVGTNVHEGEDKERSTLMGGKGTFLLRRGGMHMDPLHKRRVFLLRKRGAKSVPAQRNII